MMAVRARTKESAVYTAEEINHHVRGTIFCFDKMGYDWDGRGGLPIREDVREQILYRLCCVASQITKPGMAAGGCPMPSVYLQPDGTVFLQFVEGLRGLKIHVRCREATTFCKTFDDGQTRIDGRLPGSHSGDRSELADCFDWLLEGSKP